MADSDDLVQESDKRSVAFEASDANVRGLFITGAVLGGLSVAIMIGLIPAYDFFARRADRVDGSNAPLELRPLRFPRAPQLEGLPAPAEEAQAAIDAGHGGYGWVDRPQQIARIPVEQAMKLLTVMLPAPPQAVEPTPPQNRKLFSERTHSPGPSSSGRIVETDRDDKSAAEHPDNPPRPK